jgi:hypothetical protein
MILENTWGENTKGPVPVFSQVLHHNDMAFFSHFDCSANESAQRSAPSLPWKYLTKQAF